MASKLVDFESKWFDWANQPYKIGFWSHFSREGAFARTLTLPSNESKILLAVIALFVATVGSYTWNLVCFIIHQLISRSEGTRGLYQQRQVVLRNVQSPVTTLWYLLKLSWAWKSRRKQLYPGQILLIIIAILHIAMFLVAAISAVNLVSIGNDVLLRREVCPIFNFTGLDINQLARATADYRQDLQRSVQYVRNCYSTPFINNNPACGRLMVERIPTEFDTAAVCPFEQSHLCRNSTAGVFRVQTSLLDSHDHFGLNSRTENRVNYKKVLTCTPLPFLEDPAIAQERPANTSAQEREGHTYIDVKYTLPPLAFPNNASGGGIGYHQPYYISAYPWYPGAVYVNSTTSAGIVPEMIEDLRLQDADVTLSFLYNQVIYLDTSDDILFGTRRFISKEACKCNNLPEGAEGSWKADVVSIFACAEQHQFCNPTNNRCTPLDGIVNLAIQEANTSSPLLWKVKQDIGFNPRQHATASFISMVSDKFGFVSLMGSLGGSSMLAQDNLLGSTGTTSTKLQSNQTKLEIEHWFHVQMAAIQHSFVKSVELNPGLEQFLMKIQDPDFNQVCKSQIIHNPEYLSFSVAGIALILALGITLIFIALTIEPSVRYWRRLMGDKPASNLKQKEWESGELLHLQRMAYAYESSGQGAWNGSYTLIPRTE